MPRYFVTDQARKRFKRWLADQEITVSEFSRRCGCSHQYIGSVINGKIPVTATVKDWFKKGGYDLI